MIFEQHYLDCLSQASYVIADDATRRAVVVDPRRDVAPYLATADEHGLDIVLVIETHFHADFLSGHLELAAITGADVAYGSVAETAFPSRPLSHGERISLGDVTLEIRHTPGHTPESISIVVYERADDDVPFGVLTGDTLFIGDVGRPDLLSSGYDNSTVITSEDLAGQLYDSLQQHLLTLPDATRVYPAHGAGSACGKNLSTDTWSTIGEQRTDNYALQPMTRDAFVAVVTDGQTAPPAYFSYDAAMNREQHEILDDRPPEPLTLAEVLRLQRGGAVVLDTRDPVDFGVGHLIGSINVGLAGRYAEFAGGVIQPGARIVLVTDPEMESESKVRLGRIGYDHVLGHLDNPLDTFAANPEDLARARRIAVPELVDLLGGDGAVQLVDVRQPGETADGIIAGATLVPMTRLNERLASLDASKPTVVYCAGGFRSSIAASRLRAAGFADVCDLLGGYSAWSTSHVSIG